ncbi:MAG: Gfo/Idh/MocA family oxidoreductase [Thermoleophilaceae bacterium]|nr:Gfo/Idh/MocA family oxidoreductase [Thermoleophilaceae bacterium]
MVTSPLRLGLLSTAKINEALLAAPPEDVAVVAVASRDRARARAYAQEHEIEHAHGSYEALLDDPDVDAVYVSLPNGLHHEWTMRALAAGKHVLCEKPYTRRPTEVEEAWDAAAARGLVVAEALMYRHHPQVQRTKDLVDAGAIGRLRLIRSSFSVRLLDRGNHRMLSELDGGALMDLGCYCVNASRLLAGEPEHVLGEQVLAASGVDVDFHGTLRFPGDVVARFDVSFALPSYQRVEAVGEEGTLALDAPFRPDWGFTLSLTRGEEVEEVDVPQADSYRLELEDLAAAVRGERAPLLGRDDALGQARTIEALYRSAETGTAVAA